LKLWQLRSCTEHFRLLGGTV